MSLTESLHFLRQFVENPIQVGSVAPSSPRLARALLAPLRQKKGPARILEVGAGSGAITRWLIDALGADDRLDVCEIRPDFARCIEREVRQSVAERPELEGRIRVLCCPVQAIDAPGYYDFIISGLPLNGFEPSVVRSILAGIRKNLHPEGTFSYFEYVGFRRVMAAALPGGWGRRIRRVSNLMTAHIRRHQIDREAVLLNLPPAFVRHWQFDKRLSDWNALYAAAPVSPDPPDEEAGVINGSDRRAMRGS